MRLILRDSRKLIRERHLRQMRQGPRQDQGGYVVWLVLVVLLLATVGAWRYSVARKESRDLALGRAVAPNPTDRPRAGSVREERRQLEARVADDKQRRDALVAANKALDDLLLRWHDALQVAGSTSKISLSGPVGNLQALRREAQQLTVAPCMDAPKQLLVEGMNSSIQGFLVFMGNNGEYLARAHLLDGSEKLVKFVAAREQCPKA